MDKVTIHDNPLVELAKQTTATVTIPFTLYAMLLRQSEQNEIYRRLLQESGGYISYKDACAVFRIPEKTEDKKKG